MDDLSRTLAKYPELAEAHRQAALLAQTARSEVAYAHEIEPKAWYEREAEKLRGKLSKREQKGR